MIAEITTLSGSGEETTQEPSKHLADWHNLKLGNYDESDLAEVHDRLHGNRDEMANLDEDSWHVHPNA